MPGSKSRKGYGAEITVTAEPYVTEELLPETFRQLVVNDVVDQLSVPVFHRTDAAHSLNEAYHATRSVVTDIAIYSPPMKLALGSRGSIHPG